MSMTERGSGRDRGADAIIPWRVAEKEKKVGKSEKASHKRP
jgi:hypothetical protein